MLLALFPTGGCGSTVNQNRSASNLSQLKIVDINVWSGLNYRGKLKMGEYESPDRREKRFRILVDRLKELSPHVITIHEANKLPGYIRRLAEELGMDSVFHMGLSGARLGPVGIPVNLSEGDAILARRDLFLKYIDRKQISGGYVGEYASFHTDDATQVIAATIQVNGKTVWIFTTHWHASVPDTRTSVQVAYELAASQDFSQEDLSQTLRWIAENHEWRKNEADKTLSFIRELAGNGTVILTGDFNAVESSEEIGLLKFSGFSDVFRIINPSEKGYTWSPEDNTNILKYYAPRWNTSENLTRLMRDRSTSTPCRIDYIFLKDSPNEFLRPVSSEIVLNRAENGIHPSDHYGVMAVFELN